MLAQEVLRKDFRQHAKQRAGPLLFVFFLDGYLLQVLGFEDLTAVQALDVVHAVTPGDYHGPVMLTSELHSEIGFILSAL
jgi:hypothetical protein